MANECKKLLNKIVKHVTALEQIREYNARPEVIAAKESARAAQLDRLNKSAQAQSQTEEQAKAYAQLDQARSEVIKELIEEGYTKERAEFATNTPQKMAAQAIRFGLV